MQIADFDVEESDNCNMDFLEIREGSSMGKLLKVLCGHDRNRFSGDIKSSSSLWIKFKTDDLGTAKGFHISYSIGM